VYTLEDEVMNNYNKSSLYANWTIQSNGVLTDSKYPYDSDTFFIYRPKYYENEAGDFIKYSWTGNGLDVNRFSYRCNFSSHPEEYSYCNSDKKKFLIKFLSIDTPLDLLEGSLDPKFLTSFDFGEIAQVHINHVNFNYTRLKSKEVSTVQKINTIINQTAQISMFLRNDYSVELQENILHQEGADTISESRYIYHPLWYRKINPNYLEWVMLTIYLIFQYKNINSGFISETASLGKYCIALYFLNSQFEELGRYVVCNIPELILLSTGLRQSRGFRMLLRKNLIKEDFFRGNCLTYTVLYCIENNISKIDVKRCGDEFHIRPGKMVNLRFFLNMYLSGFYLNERKVTFHEKFSILLSKKDYLKCNTYTSVMWSLFERQGYVSDFATFEGIVASFHPVYSRFKSNLRGNNILISSETCKRVIYFVFANTKVNLPNWGNYRPKIVQYSFVKRIKNNVERQNETEYKLGRQGISSSYVFNDTKFSCIVIDPIPTIIESVTKIKEKPVFKVYTEADFVRSAPKGSTRLCYKERIKPNQKQTKKVKKIRYPMCSSCYQLIEIEIKDLHPDIDSKVFIVNGHSRKCLQSYRNLIPANGKLRLKIEKDYKYNCSYLDKVFINKNLSLINMAGLFQKVKKRKLLTNSTRVNEREVISQKFIPNTNLKTEVLNRKPLASELISNHHQRKIQYLSIRINDKTLYLINPEEKLVKRSILKASSYFDEMSNLIDFDISFHDFMKSL
jgi:hypothetical protein